MSAETAAAEMEAYANVSSPERSNDKDLIGRMNRWANERFNLHKITETFFQWRARKSVVHAVENDIKHEANQKQISAKEFEKRNKKYLSLLAGSTAGYITTQLEDVLTGQKYFTVIRKKDGAIYAEERRTEYDPAQEKEKPNDLISQVILSSKDGKGLLSLNFVEPQYAGKNANPNFFNRNYPRAALKVFDLLAGAAKMNASGRYTAAGAEKPIY